MSSSDMSLKKKPVWAVISAILLLCSFFSVSAQPVSASFKTVFSFNRGTGENQLLWLTEDNGGVLDGPFQGPMAFKVDKNSNLWAGDTLNARVVAFDKKTSRPGKIIDLISAGRKAGLASDPVLLDFVPAAGNKLLVADAANNAVLAIDLNGEKVTVFRPAGEASWLQINRIHSDSQGRIYIEDIASMKSFVLTSAGKSFCEPLDGEVSLGVASDGSMAMVVNDPQSADRRQLVFAKAPGEPFESIAVIKAPEPIIWASVVGFSKDLKLTIVYDTASARNFSVFGTDGRMIRSYVVENHDPGYDLTTPEWVGSDSGIYSVAIASETLYVKRLE